MNGLGKPHDGDKYQNGQSLIDIGVIRQDLIKHGADDGGNYRDEQAAKTGNGRLRAQ